MIYYELITKKNKSKHHSSPRGLLIGLMYYPTYIGSHDTKLQIDIFSLDQKRIQEDICIYTPTLSWIRRKYQITMLRMEILSNNQHDDRRSSSICRSSAQLPGQKSYCSRTIMVQKELGEKIVCLNFFRKFVFGETSGQNTNMVSLLEFVDSFLDLFWAC